MDDDDLTGDERHAVDFARQQAFTSFLDDADEGRANELFSLMIVEAFAGHFDEEPSASRTAVEANALLASWGWRLVRETDWQARGAP